MAKGFGKFLFKTALIGAAAYGAYYYLRKEEVLTPVVDEEDSSESCEEDLDGEPTKARSYINLSFDKAKAEDLAKNAVKKARITINDSVQKVEEFFNDELISDEDVVETAVPVSEGVVSEEFLNEDSADAEATEPVAKEVVEEAVEEAVEAVTEAVETVTEAATTSQNSSDPISEAIAAAMEAQNN